MRFFVTLLLVLAGCCAAFSADADKTFAELDRQLSMKAYYERQKLGRIDSLRREMAAETFKRVSAYDGMIADYLAKTPL